MKKLSDNSPVTPDKQFRNEVGNLRAIQHENIVRLYGYCYELQRKVIELNGTHIRVEVSERFLCYELKMFGKFPGVTIYPESEYIYTYTYGPWA